MHENKDQSENVCLKIKVCDAKFSSMTKLFTKSFFKMGKIETNMPFGG